MTKAVVLMPTGAELSAAVSDREYARLLLLPRGRALEGELRERALGARAFYAENGRPYAAARRAELAEVASGSVALTSGQTLRSEALADLLGAGGAHALVALAASAGPEVGEAVARLWAEQKPDEAFFLDRFAAAVTERLVFWSAGEICRSAEPTRETLLPHLSPGCGRFELSNQQALMALLTGSERETRLGPLQLLCSGALSPVHSILAAYGVTRRAFAATPADLCRACELERCAFRRAPFAGELRVAAR